MGYVGITFAEPGTTLKPGGGGAMYLSSTRGACGASLMPIPASHSENSPIGCWVAVYLDGLRIYQYGDDEAPVPV